VDIKKVGVVLVALFTVCLLVATPKISAVPLESPNFKMDAQVLNNFGGAGSSSEYKMVSSGGEAVVGNGEGGSYKLSGGYVSQLQDSIEVRLNPHGLKAAYDFDTYTGTQLYDGTINNNNGTLKGASSWKFGKFDKAIEFSSAKTGYIDMGSPSAANITGDITISAWVAPAAWTAAHGIISWGNGGSASPYTMTIGTNRRVSFACTGCTTRTSTAAKALPTPASTSTWTNVVVTISGTSLKFYINGVLDSTTTVPATRSSGNGSLYLGRSGATYMNGRLDEVNIYNRAMTARDVSETYKSYAASFVNRAVIVPQIVPGASQEALLDMSVATDAGGGYNALISENGRLFDTSTSTVIPRLNNGGTIDTPVLWDEGTTVGLGFTLIGGDKPVPAKWGTGPASYKYAEMNGSPIPEAFYSRDGQSTGGTKETTTMQFRLDVPKSQLTGTYQNKMTITTTTKP
jgi:hypothetical protein